MESPQDSHAVDANVQAIKRWEHALQNRSRAETVADWVTHAAARGPVLLFHVGWFAFWVLANLGAIPSVTPFDLFPFPLLTMTVSLEAIFLTLFVLASQKRLAEQTNKRAHLDLQVDLLAEQEMTVMLRLLQDIARHLDVKITGTPTQARELAKETDIHSLTDRLDDIQQPAPDSTHTAS